AAVAGAARSARADLARGRWAGSPGLDHSRGRGAGGSAGALSAQHAGDAGAGPGRGGRAGRRGRRDTQRSGAATLAACGWNNMGAAAPLALLGTWNAGGRTG